MWRERPQFLGQSHWPPPQRMTDEEDLLRQLQQQLQHQPEMIGQQHNAQDNMDLEHVPRGLNGELTSTGSIGHNSCNCSPCIFVGSSPGCLTGHSCGYCHMPHAKAAKESRPCKGKRIRYARLLSRLNTMIHEDPGNLRLEVLDLPPSMKAKFFELSRAYVQQVKEGHGAQPASSSNSQNDEITGLFTQFSETDVNTDGILTADFQSNPKEQQRWNTTAVPLHDLFDLLGS